VPMTRSRTAPEIGTRYSPIQLFRPELEPSTGIVDGAGRAGAVGPGEAEEVAAADGAGLLPGASFSVNPDCPVIGWPSSLVT